MSKVDDELTRRLRRAERLVDVDGLFEGLERRRSHRDRVRKVQAGMLAFAVLAATAGGFVALREVFDSDQREAGEAPLSANGEIVFVRGGTDGRSRLYAAQPDGSGLRRITDATSNDTDPAVSPDGRTIAYVRTFDEIRQRIAIVSIDGGPLIHVSEAHLHAAHPAWSPDGMKLAYVASGIDSQQLFTADPAGRERREVIDSPGQLADPTWSADGGEIAFATRGNTGPFRNDSWDLGTVAPGAAEPQVEQLLLTERDEEAPAWSPDGARIAFTRPGEEGDEIWTIDPDGGSETLLATAVEASLEPDLAWAPDGSALLVSDGDWIYRVDATPDGDPRDNFVQLVKGHSPSWQPLPVGSEPPATPSPSPSPEPEGRDIGLGFNLCHDDRLGGVNFLGDGTRGQAWVGVPTKDDGTCPGVARAAAYVVVVDADANGQADAWSELPWACLVDCVPFAAVDLDENGTEELIVTSYFSIMDYYVLAYTDQAELSPRISPILVAEPGHRPAGLIAGDPFRIDAGGDAGYSSEIVCKPPVITWTWTFAPIDSQEPTEVHYVEIELRDDGAFHVIGTNDFTVPAGQPTGATDHTAPSCGVDWHPAP